MGAYNPLIDAVKLHVADGMQFPLITTTTNSIYNHPCKPFSSSSLDRRPITSINQSINPTASPTNSLNHSLIGFKDHLSSSDYHSFSSHDPSEFTNYPPLRSCNPPPSSPDAIMSSNSNIASTIPVPMSSDEPSLNYIRPPPSDKAAALRNIQASSSTVPFKWEEAPGKPISTSTLLHMASHSDKFPCNASPLQLPPKLQPQAQYHSQLHLQSPSRMEFDCVYGSPTIHHMHSPHMLQPIYQIKPPAHIPLSQTFPFELPSFPHSPFVLQQKLKRVCTSLLRSTSWSQPLHKLTPPCTSFACHGNSVDELELEEKVASYDRFFFDKTDRKDFMYNSSMDSRTSALPAYEHSQRQFPTLPVFDKSHAEDEFVGRDALRFLAMEDVEAESIASSPWQPIPINERQGSGLCSWPPASIINLYDIDDDDGFHDFFSPTSSLEVVSQRSEEEETEPACSTPRPWFLDFSPHEEEKNQVVNKASNKMSLVRFMALIKLKSIISNKVGKLRRRRRREGAYQQEKSMWSPTLATYLYNNLHNKETLKERTPTTLHHISEDEQSSPDEGHLRINYHLPSSIKGQLISNRYYLDDDLVSPNQARLASTSPSFSADDKEKPRKAAHRLSLREQLAHFNDEYLCPDQTKDHPPAALQRREHAHACKGMCKFRKTVQVLATSMKLILVQMDDGKKGARRASQKYRSSLKTIFPLSSPHK